jgi:hypothetical protein
MAAKEIIVKKHVVRLNGDEREQLAALTRKGRGPAQRLMKARILLKADAFRLVQQFLPATEAMVHPVPVALLEGRGVGRRYLVLSWCRKTSA